MQDTLESLEEQLHRNCHVQEYLNQQQKECNENYVKLQRKKWWLLNPNIVSVSYVAVYKTNYSHSEWETYPEISFRNIDNGGGDVSGIRNADLFLPLESEITDGETVITVRNPYISSAETA